MKFVLIGDRHNMQRTPQSRDKKEFESTCLKKDKEILDIARNVGAAAILHPGDFWDDHNRQPSNEFIQAILSRWYGMPISVDRIISAFKNRDHEELKKIGDSVKGHIPLVGIAGNHDLPGNAIELLSDSTAGLLDSYGLMPLVSKDKPMFFKDNGKTIAITGSHYTKDIDTPADTESYIVREKLGDFHIHIVHGMLTLKDLGDKIPHTTVDKISHTKADVTLCGHEHTGFKPTVIDGKMFLNPGSVVRVSNSKSEIKRTPLVFVLDTDTRSVDIIELKSAPKGSEILSRAAIDEKKAKESFAETFRSEVEKYEIEKTGDIKDVLMAVMDNEKIDESLRNEYFQVIAAKQTEIRSSIPATKDTYIAKLELENFQSHKHTVYNFADGLNVIVGESRRGKTATMRAIRLLYENRPTGRKFIRRGEKYCRVTATLGNGTIISRIIDADPKGTNGYEVVFPDGKIISGKTNLLNTIRNYLGICEFCVDNKESLNINFMRQGDSWYLVGDGVSPAQRARAIGAIMDTNAVDSAAKDTEKCIKSINSSIKSAEKEIEKLDTKMISYGNMAEKKAQIDILAALIAKAENLSTQITNLKTLQDAIADLKAKISLEDKIIASVKAVELKHALLEVKSKYEHALLIDGIQRDIRASEGVIAQQNEILKQEELIDLLYFNLDQCRDSLSHLAEVIRVGSEIRNLETELSSANRAVTNLGSIPGIKKRCLDAQAALSKLLEIAAVHKELSRASKALAAIKKVETQLNSIGTLREQATNTRTGIVTLADIIQASQEVTRIKTMVTAQNANIKTEQDKLVSLKKQRDELLTGMEHCPACGQKISGGHKHG